MKKELSILQAYYNAMSSQDLKKTVSFLSDDVRVCFPEEDRNWCGSGAAREKFGGMFKKRSTFQASYSILTQKRTKGYLEVKVACKFSCEQTNMSSNRDMVYHITENAIVYIAHL
jgi:ketosteroid isomerase-like protein